MNTHRNDVSITDGPPRDKHFQMLRNNFNVHAKFTITLKKSIISFYQN